MEYQLYSKEDVTRAEARQDQAGAANRLACKVSLIILVIIFSSGINAQSVPEVGFSGGISQYMGDYNNSKLIYQPSPCGGFEFVFNFNQRYGFRTGVNYFSIKGDGNLLYIANEPSSFNNAFLEYHILTFVNFLDYDFELDKDNFTPYFLTGFNYSRPLGGGIGSQHFAIPFGPGVKYLVNNKISLGLEYILNRTFSDAVDNKDIMNYGDWLDPEKDGSKESVSNFNNNDWYSYLRLVITFKFINFAGDCPTYE